MEQMPSACACLRPKSYRESCCRFGHAGTHVEQRHGFLGQQRGLGDDHPSQLSLLWDESSADLADGALHFTLTQLALCFALQLCCSYRQPLLLADCYSTG